MKNCFECEQQWPEREAPAMNTTLWEIGLAVEFAPGDTNQPEHARTKHNQCVGVQGQGVPLKLCQQLSAKICSN
jgi:hypothetical protein